MTRPDTRRYRGRRRRSDTSPRPRLRLAVRVVATLVSLSLFAASGFVWHLQRSLNDGVHHLAIASLGRPVAASGPTAVAVRRTSQNILLVGDDSRSDLTSAERKLLATGSDVSMSTDTMIIVHTSADGGPVTLTSLPRDAYVDIPGHGMDKLNAAYALGYTSASGSTDERRAAGAGLLVRTVEDLTGVTIDHFVQIGLIGFYRIAKAVHGIPVTLCHAVNDSFARNRAAGLQGGSDLVLPAGHQVLNPVQSLKFVRQRHFLPNGDIDRTARQRYFLHAAFAKIASAGVLLDPVALTRLVDALQSSVYVDSSFSIIDFARQLATVPANDIEGAVIPFEHYANVTIDGATASVEIVSPERVRAFFAAEFAPKTVAARSPGATSRPAASVAPRTPAAESPSAQRCID